MIIGLNTLKAYHLRATDGEIGAVKDFYFDDFEWVVRYLVADTGDGGDGRQVLIATAELGRVTPDEQLFRVELTRAKVIASPEISADRPVSRQEEENLFQYYGWSPYWMTTGGMVPGLGMAAIPVSGSEGGETETQGNPHLRSLSEVTGYRIAARDGDIGSVSDLLVNDEDWRIMYMVVDTGGLFPGKKVLMAPAWVQQVSWAQSALTVDLEKETIRAAPEYNPDEPLDRDYEDRLYGHYDRKGYWKQDE
jgi:uncharacterized protein YrrD